MLTFAALVALAGCHRRYFEKEAPRGEVIVASTTVITNADVPVTEPQPAPAARATPASPAAPATDPSHLYDETFRPTDEPARDAGAKEEPASAPAPAAKTPAPEPAPSPQADEPPRRRASAADRVPWAGDSYRP